MVILGLLFFFASAVLPASAGSWTTWLVFSVLSALPAILILWLVFGPDGETIGWLIVLMLCLFASSAVGICAGAIGIVGRQRGWRLASRPFPACFAFLIVSVPLVFAVGSSMSVIP